ncbi:MAG: prepilin-type N-terminal cleavage/methylation domain-containing protein [Kangiellaceae bacterium]|nr:prepilin-type N-terminal cleavage/methylation domain-containing protein [Kangiellaceae bacterium]
MESFQNKSRSNSKLKGFTLLELIIVILLISILLVSVSNITSFSVYGYIDAKDRIRLSQSSKWIVERISREVREGLPQSIREGVSGNIHCVEFMNIVNASTYLDLPAAGPVTSFNAVGFDLTFAAGMLVAIMPINPSATYAGSGTLGSVASITPTGTQSTITLTGPTVFARRSPQNRFYLLDSPVSFCLNDNNGQINRYTNYTISAAQAFPPTGGTTELMGENFSINGDVFNYQPGTLSRSGILQINLVSQNRNRNLTGNSESFEVFHEVHIRNVP